MGTRCFLTAHKVGSERNGGLGLESVGVQETDPRSWNLLFIPLEIHPFGQNSALFDTSSNLMTVFLT